MEKELTATDVQNKLTDYKDIIASFINLLQTENQALRDYNIEEIGRLYKHKVKTVGAYRSIVAFFIKHQELLAELPAEVRSELKSITQQLDTLMKENDILLKSKMETSQSVMDSIVRLAKMTNKSNATAYGAEGSYSKVDNSKNSIAVNRTL